MKGFLEIWSFLERIFEAKTPETHSHIGLRGERAPAKNVCALRLSAKTKYKNYLACASTKTKCKTEMPRAPTAGARSLYEFLAGLAGYVELWRGFMKFRAFFVDFATKWSGYASGPPEFAGVN